MIWNKTKCAEGILAPDFNDEVRENNEALEEALTKEHLFSTGETPDSNQGHHRQGSAKCYFQDTAPATRINGDAFTSADLGSLWFDTNSTIDNQFNVLTATTPTWTPVSTEIIAVLLASSRTFAEAITFSKAAVLSKAPTLTEGIVANNSYLQARNQADDGNVDLIKADGSDVPTLPDASALATSAAPTADAEIANKKFVDDSVSVSQQRVNAWGRVGSSGTLQGSGYNISTAKAATGTYTVTWGTAFADTNYSVVATAQHSVATYIIVSAIATGSCTIKTYGTSGNLADAGFCVMAIE